MPSYDYLSRLSSGDLRSLLLGLCPLIRASDSLTQRIDDLTRFALPPRMLPSVHFDADGCISDIVNVVDSRVYNEDDLMECLVDLTMKAVDECILRLHESYKSYKSLDIQPGEEE